MTPRLTKFGRWHRAKVRYENRKLMDAEFAGYRAKTGMPSPAEKRKARSKSQLVRLPCRVAEIFAIPKVNPGVAYLDHHHAMSEAMRAHKLAIDNVIFTAFAGWPEPRGTTAQQLTAMHLEAEEQ